LVYPHPSLRQKTIPVKQVDQELQTTVRLLEKALGQSQLGIGLAAPQIGRHQRVFLMKKLNQASCEKCDQCHCSPFKVLVNPQIIDTFGLDKTYPQLRPKENSEEPFLEGCLSFPQLYGPVKRWLKIKVSYQQPDFDRQRLELVEAVLEDLEAIVFQHELDHLDGILFIDHVQKRGDQLYLQEKKKMNPITLDQWLAR